MRILILGGDGMLGHQLLTHFENDYEVRVTLREDLRHYKHYGLFNETNTYDSVDVRVSERLLEVFSDYHPEVVINAVGIVKQRELASDSIPSLEINALLPHRLALLANATGSRVIHMSTDCVFSGTKGRYTEADLSDAADLYGQSKYLGELHDAHCVTLRTSIIGLELARKKSLVEWFLAQEGTIGGFTKAIYTGLTTTEMGRVIEHLIVRKPGLSGLWHVAAEPISKYDLLSLLAGKLGREDICIEPDDILECDRSLDGSRFLQESGYRIPSWNQMLDELATVIRDRNE